MRRPETYEERADVAEYQVERLEGMLYRFLAATKNISEVPGLDDLREDWDRYRDEED